MSAPAAAPTAFEAFFDVDPGLLRINAAFKCTCRGGRGKVYSSADHKRAKAKIMDMAVEACDGTAPVFPEGPVVVEYERRPSRVHRQGPSTGLGQLDVDAPSKALLDALNGSAYADDSQVSRVVGTKTTEGPVGIRVRVYQAEVTRS